MSKTGSHHGRLDATYVFAYGSLADARAVDRPRLVHARGFRRTWGVAMDNRSSLPGYKFYLDPDSDERPAVYVTFLDLVADSRVAANGVLVPVEDSALPDLDARERNYDRVEITERVQEPVDGRVWVYIGSADARNRYLAGARAGTAVVDAVYRETVERQFRELGELTYREFTASTDPPACPVRPLRRIDL